ncbi:PxKF domain-containing protein [Pseudarthrobacter oxydans]|uniref:PxKF domain-containing protein n=1 Tax=Pseudarthrobacter oxydans TaxID=1671 RepID=UPI003D2C1C48
MINSLGRQTSDEGKGLLRRTSTRAAAAVAAGAMVLAGGGIAWADDIKNTLDPSVDAVAEVMALNVGGTEGSTTLALVETNGDGKNGCNLTGSTVLTLQLSSSNPAIATVSPSSVTFTSCGDTKALTVSPVGVGSATISATERSNTTAGSFNLAPATFNVDVTAPAPSNTAPKLTISGAENGVSYPKGSVPAAICNVADKEDGTKTFVATVGDISGPDAATGIGTQTASCSYTDNGGLFVASSVTYGITDGTAPLISYTLSPADPDGSNGWYKSAVVLEWTVTEGDSPSTLEQTGCEDQNITADQMATDYSCSATSAGGTAATETVNLKKDGTAPTVGYTDATGTAGTNGWYTSDVEATFTGTDATSGLLTSQQKVASSGEGDAVQVLSPAFTDIAGNTTPEGTASHTFKIDKTAPTVTFDSVIAEGYYGSTPPAPTCKAEDTVSGVDGNCVVEGYGTAVGTHTMKATAKDIAGNTTTISQSYEVKAWTLKGFYQPIDMNGVLNTVKGGSAVPAKFEVFAGTTELTDPSLVSFSAAKIQCTSGATEDALEVVATGNTSLRYDATAGQFVYNWKTPTGAGSCYKLTMTAKDGSSMSANFKLK